LFADPDAPSRVRAELDAELAMRSYADVDAAHAIAHQDLFTTATT